MTNIVADTRSYKLGSVTNSASFMSHSRSPVNWTGFVLTLLGILGGSSKKRSQKRSDCGNITVDCFLAHFKCIKYQ
jgi:hypothetical protein